METLFGDRYKYVHTWNKDAYGQMITVTSLHSNNHGVISGEYYNLYRMTKTFTKNPVDTLKSLKEIRLLRIMKHYPLINNLVDIIPPPDPKSFKQVLSSYPRSFIHIYYIYTHTNAYILSNSL